MERRKFLQQSAIASAGILAGGRVFAGGAGSTGSASGSGFDFPVVRTAAAKRKFTSPIVEKTIREVRATIGNKEIGWLFENCFPNTLDTTVDFSLGGGRPDTYVITGDIDAMWLRDSSAQVWPYIGLCKDDKDLQQLVRGVIHRQATCILRDPYANAFYKDAAKISEWKSDLTDMKPGIHERKWEIDSLCYPIRLAHGYWEVTGDTSPFDEEWLAAMKRVLETFKQQQRKASQGPYTFQRVTQFATDTVPMKGYGYPTKKVGLIHSMFRPSDDATIYPFLVPSNIFALTSLRNLRKLFKALNKGQELDGPAYELESDLERALMEHAIVPHPVYGDVFAYEVDGFGNHTFMDDANVPSLLALPYLQSRSTNTGDLSVLASDKRGYAVYQNTRRMVLSEANPFFFKGKAGEGIGGPHVGIDMIWPISIIIRGITSHDSQEIAACLKTLQHTHAGTGFMHESFHKDDASKYSRPWFAWANTLFGEFVLKVYREQPGLLS
jgi:meiotically up-regulated gene 157 (Mug157) protein